MKYSYIPLATYLDVSEESELIRGVHEFSQNLCSLGSEAHESDVWIAP